MFLLAISMLPVRHQSSSTSGVSQVREGWAACYLDIQLPVWKYKTKEENDSHCWSLTFLFGCCRQHSVLSSFIKDSARCRPVQISRLLLYGWWIMFGWSAFKMGLILFWDGINCRLPLVKAKDLRLKLQLKWSPRKEERAHGDLLIDDLSHAAHFCVSTIPRIVSLRLSHIYMI